MLLYADYYKIIKSCKIGDKSYYGIIARINKLEVNTVTPLLFDLFSAKQNQLLSDDEMENALRVIESYIVRRMICNLPTSALNKIFVYMGAEIQKYVDSGATYIEALKYSVLSKAGKSRFPNDRDFYEKFVNYELYNAKPSAKKYLLERLENHNTKERIAVEEQIDSGELTIEHVMPQSLSEEWKSELGKNWELTHTKYIDTIGNLTLTAYNSDYSNLSFYKKKNMPEKGFVFSKLSLNNYIKGCDSWGENQIKERADILYSWAIELWKTPKSSFVPEVVEEWLTLEDEIDFTNMTIYKINLLGDEILTDNITDAYKKINATLYMLDPVRFSKLNNTYQNEKKENLRTPYALSSTMFIETNLSSQHKISILRDLFENFELDLQELKFLVRQKQKESATLDLSDETTYKSAGAGELAYKMFEKLLTENKLTVDEIVKLTTKEYTRATFYKVVYPVLAYRRDANRGNSLHYRYYKTPVKSNGVDYYISSQWFDESKNDLIRYYKKFYNK